jgi:phosphate starvation-inducible membrane PsiE
MPGVGLTISGLIVWVNQTKHYRKGAFGPLFVYLHPIEKYTDRNPTRKAEIYNNMSTNTPKEASKLEATIEKWTVPVGNLFVSLFHRIALFGIGAATVWSAAVAFLGMMSKGSASIEDLLLLFIYLEIGAMVGIYFKTNHMPVRFLIYVAITAVTRLIIDLVNTKHEADLAILFMGLTILILAIANAVVRYASFKYPSKAGDNE